MDPKSTQYCSVCKEDDATQCGNECEEGYTFDDVVGKCIDGCPTYSSLNEETGECDCEHGYDKVGDQCKESCGNYKRGEDGECTDGCKEGYERQGGVEGWCEKIEIVCNPGYTLDDNYECIPST